MRKPRIVLALLSGAALFSFLFLPDLLDGRVFAYRDAADYHLPMSRLISGELRAGRLPFWNPVIACGTPLAANPNNYAWYPTRLLELALSPEAALQAHFFLHWIAGAAAMAALAGALGASLAASVGAGSLYLLCGPALSLLNFANLAPFLFWAPATMLAAAAMRRAPGAGPAAALAGCLAVQTTFAEPGLLAAEALGVLAAFAAARPDATAPAAAPGRALRVVGWSALAAVLALALAAPMWIPEVVLVAGSARAVEGKALMSSSVPAPALAQLVVPQFLGDYHTLEKRTYWGEVFNQGQGPFFLSLSFGAVALASAAAGIAARPRRAWPLVAVAVVAIVLAMGRHFAPLRPWMMSEGGGWFRWPVKLTFAAALVLPPLAAAGWTALAGSDRPREVRRAAAAALAVGLLLAVAALRAAATLGDPAAGTGWLAELIAPVAGAKDVAAIAVDTRLRLLRTAAFAGAAGFGAVIAFAASRGSRALPLAAAFVVLAVLELAPPQRAVNRGTPVEVLRDDAPVLRDARAIAADGYRVEFPRYHWDVQMPRTPDLPDEWWPRQRLDRELGNFYTAIGEGVPMVFLDPDRLVSPGAAIRSAGYPSLGGREQQAMARLLGVRGKVVAGRAALLGDRAPYPTIAGYPVTVAIDSAAVPIAAWMASLPELEGMGPWQRDFLRAAWAHAESARDPAAVVVSERRPGRWKLDVRSDRGGYVALTETADGGWRVRVDDRPAEIVPYLADFQAVAVPAGAHVVEWDYRPRGWPGLLALGLAGAVGIAGLGAVARRRRAAPPAD